MFLLWKIQTYRIREKRIMNSICLLLSCSNFQQLSHNTKYLITIHIFLFVCSVCFSLNPNKNNTLWFINVFSVFLIYSLHSVFYIFLFENVSWKTMDWSMCAYGSFMVSFSIVSAPCISYKLVDKTVLSRTVLLATCCSLNVIKIKWHKIYNSLFWALRYT